MYRGLWRLAQRTELGLGLLAFVEVSLHRSNPEAFDQLREQVADMGAVQECHMIAGASHSFYMNDAAARRLPRSQRSQRVLGYRTQLDSTAIRIYKLG